MPIARYTSPAALARLAWCEAQEPQPWYLELPRPWLSGAQPPGGLRR